MNTLPDKCLDLIISDPPYYSTGIESVGDNQFKNEQQYLEWIEHCFIEYQRILKPNGSLYLFHNDTNIMTDVLYNLKHKSNLVLQNQIIWSKINTHNNFSRIIKTYGSNRRYGKTFTEYIYFFTFEDLTGLQKIRDDKCLYKELREYFWNERNKIRHLSYKDINEKIGFASNGGGVASGVLNSRKKGWRFPKEDTYNKFKCLGIFDKDYSDLKIIYNKYNHEYECMRKSIESNRYQFNQPYVEFKGTSIQEQKNIIKPYTDVWEYEKDKVKINHSTPKPVEMIKHILNVSSKKGDLVYIPFAGSGSDIVACIETERNYIATETNNDYINDIIIPRIG